MWRLAKRIYWVLSILTVSLIIVKTVDYLTPDFTNGFLSVKEHFFNSYSFFFYAHIIASPIVFFIGLYQIVNKKNNVHQYLGWFYVSLIVFFAAPGGLYMAQYAIGGIWSEVNFSIMAILWIIFTVLAALKARQRNFEQHKSFMYRSFILTNSAILIRVFAYFNNTFDILGTVNGYVLISWLSWLPWLLIYEIRRVWLSRN